jgi:hypothetical protein
MIDINLIPVALRKDGQADAHSVAINIPKEILLGVSATVIFLIVLIHLILGVLWLVGMGHLSNDKARWQKLLPDKTTFDSIDKESKDLKKKIAMLSDMTTKKSVLWAPKFNAISDALPKGLWLRRMVLDKVGLSMEGSVVSKNQNEIADVGEFVSALKQNDAFMKNFSSLEVNSIQRSKSNAVEVTDFTVMAKLIESNNETKLK